MGRPESQSEQAVGDAFVYFANWGTHEFYIRLPQESVDYKLLKAIIPGQTVRVRRTTRFVIVEFGSESEWDGEDDGTGWMASLMPLRSDLLRGDLRCLYLGWLRSAQDGGLDEDEMEPPVPAGLQELSGSLDALIEFLEINEDLVEVAAQASKPLAAGPSRKEVSAWIRGLSEKDKNEFAHYCGRGAGRALAKRRHAAFPGSGLTATL
jgi:hypothetical protein